jgi:L,D-peptidoglycan transpeptidase YkuD (ErfK/YbiS/YcfS/YnhG family)
MIIINESGYLKYQDLKFKCALGKHGINKKKKEGDKITPKGTYKIVNIYYRKDRIKKISSKLKLIKIKKNMGWCDDPNNKNYNQLIKIPSKYSYERLFRKENIYDLIIVINYNMKPVIKNKGSAIFIHIAKKRFQPTKGCIAISKKNLLYLIRNISKNTKIKIVKN